MKYSLRKTPSHLHLVYKYGEPGGGVIGRNISLAIEGPVLTLDIDLEANLRARNKSSTWYVSAMFLARNPHKLKSVQCPDNLVRSRLIRAWEQVTHPVLKLRLDLGGHGRFVYEVSPHSLFMGGVQLDVREFREEQEADVETMGAPATDSNPTRHHA
ncbi:MAG: hypothetical protein HY854_02030 [Burkholderiales bacterium]|nr:hypothetical protein [Burkholderiales bacterium]